MTADRAQFFRDTIEFPPGTGGTVSAARIREVRPHQSRPEAVLVSGEILVFPMSDGWSLDLFARANGVPVEAAPEVPLRLRWSTLERALDIPIGGAAPVLSSLIAGYSEPHRHYHGIRHLTSVLERVSALGLGGEAQSAVELAAWFHDAVYTPGSERNEEESADFMVKALAPLTAAAPLIRLAAALILRTGDPLGAASREEKSLVDADLSILGETRLEYLSYASAIRLEHSGISDASFRKGRAAFLRKILETQERRGYLFHTLHPLHEELACTNLRSELEAI